MQPKQIVFVVDDNNDFRTSVAWMLRGEGYTTVEFDDGVKAITALQSVDKTDLRRSCLLLDVRMPRMSGLEFHEALNKTDITIPIIYMTGHGDIPLTVEAMRKGAVTLLEKPLNPDHLKSAIENSISTYSVEGNSELFSSTVNDDRRREFLQRLEVLTPREKDVLNGLVEGHVNKVIARNLNISVRTVEVHRSRLMKKLNIKTASEAVKLVLLCQMNH